MPRPKIPSSLARTVRANRAMWAAFARDIHLPVDDLVPHFVVTAAGHAFRPLPPSA